MSKPLKKRVWFSKAEFEALDYFLSIAQSDYENGLDNETGKKTVKEIERLRQKLAQLRLQMRS